MSVMKKGREYRERRSVSHGRCGSTYLKLETGNTLPHQRDNSKKKQYKKCTVRNGHMERKVVGNTKNMKRC